MRQRLELHTDRLILRPIKEQDAPALLPLINDPDVAANMLSMPHPYPGGGLEAWIRACKEAMERRERYEMAIVLKETGLPIGVCSLCRISWEHMNGELGYWLGKRYWGHGLMTEAVRRMIAFCFEQLGLERVYARCFDHNLASVRVLEKAGMKYEGRARHEVKKGGGFLDMLHFGLIKSDYTSHTTESTPQREEPPKR